MFSLWHVANRQKIDLQCSVWHVANCHLRSIGPECCYGAHLVSNPRSGWTLRSEKTNLGIAWFPIKKSQAFQNAPKRYCRTLFFLRFWELQCSVWHVANRQLPRSIGPECFYIHCALTAASFLEALLPLPRHGLWHHHRSWWLPPMEPHGPRHPLQPGWPSVYVHLPSKMSLDPDGSCHWLLSESLAKNALGTQNQHAWIRKQHPSFQLGKWRLQKNTIIRANSLQPILTWLRNIPGSGSKFWTSGSCTSEASMP